jgi:methionyl-tRNA formyltransferase
MKMDAGMDTGDILLQRTCPVGVKETAGELSILLAEMGGDLLIETLEKLESGDLRPVPQDDTGATLAPRIGKEDARIDWTEPASRIDRVVRAFDPVPVAFTVFRGKPLRIWKASVRPGPLPDAAGGPGTLLEVRGDIGVIACGGGSRVDVAEVQPDGGSRMSLGAFARGRGVGPGERFGGA